MFLESNLSQIESHTNYNQTTKFQFKFHGVMDVELGQCALIVYDICILLILLL